LQEVGIGMLGEEMVPVSEGDNRHNKVKG